MEPKVDVIVMDGGNVCMVHPVSEAARKWVDENVPLEGWQWMGVMFACEPRCIEYLVQGMRDDGLEVQV